MHDTLMARHPITTYVSPEELEKIEEACKRAGKKKYSWSRDALMEKLNRDRNPPQSQRAPDAGTRENSETTRRNTEIIDDIDP